MAYITVAEETRRAHAATVVCAGAARPSLEMDIFIVCAVLDEEFKSV